MPAGESPVIAGRRRRGGSSPPKKPPLSPRPARGRPPTLLPRGAEVEVRLDGDGFHGSWFEATVDGLAPASASGRRRYAVTYAHLLADDGGALSEHAAASHVRPRPPAPPGHGSSPPPFRLHDIVEAFDCGGWWSGIVVEPPAAAAAVRVAFPLTREVIAFAPSLVRPRRDFAAGKWVPSRAATAVRPTRALRVYKEGEQVEVRSEREVYGCSWLPATVSKVIDNQSYVVEYSDKEEGGGVEKATEYLHWRFIRPAVEAEPSLQKGELQLRPGAAVEAYCDGAWSPGLVHRVVKEGEYEVCVDGNEEKQLVTKVVELLRAQYTWNGSRWSIVKAKKKAKLRWQYASGKRPMSPVEVAFGDDPEYSATKKSRKELQQQLSEHASISKVDTTLSVLGKSSPTNHALNSCSQLSGNPTLPNESVPNVGKTGCNQQLQSCIMVISKNNEGTTHTMEALNRKNDTSDNVQIQSRENSNVSNKESNCAWSASSDCHITSVLTRKMPIGTSNAENMKVYVSRKSSTKKSFKRRHNPHSSLDATHTAQQRGIKEAAECMKERSVEEIYRTSEHMPNVYDVINQELLPMACPDFEPLCNGKGIDVHSSRLDDGPAATISIIDGLNSSPDVLKDIASTPVDRNNLLMMIPTLSLDGLVQQDRGNMVERSVMIGSPNDVNSQCTTENSLLRSCSGAGISVPSDLAISQISGHQTVFIRSLDSWSLIEQMDVFKKAPQKPHFHPLLNEKEECREIMALGLMVKYAAFVQNSTKWSIEDSITSFEEKIRALHHLEQNGFDVQSLQCYLAKVLELKSKYTIFLEDREKLKVKMLDKTASLSRIDSSLDVEGKVIAEWEKKLAECKKKLEQHHSVAQQITKEKEHEARELSRLQASDSSIEDACDDVRQEFHSVMAQLQRKHLM
ncbi:hypothetical protein ACP4OV_027292 [Aristida adscensionis]